MMRIANRIGLVRSAGLAAAAMMVASIVPIQRAEAVSLINPANKPSMKQASGVLTTQVRHGGGGSRGGGGFHGGGGFRGGGGFHGGFHGGGFRAAPHVFHGGGIGIAHPAFVGGGIHRGPVFRGRSFVAARHYRGPVQVYGHYRRHYGRRFYGYSDPYYYDPYYYGGYPYYYAHRRYCRVIWTYYGPRRVCRYHPWRYHVRHHWRSHHRWHHYAHRHHHHHRHHWRVYR